MSALDALAALVGAHHDDLPLDQATALVAVDDGAPGAEDPAAAVQAVCGQLDALARGIVLREGASVYEGLARLRLALFEGEAAFKGDVHDYHAVENSWLPRVLARRRGIPITLSVVLIEVARRAGLPLVGVGFPGHFLVRPAVADPPFWIDPFRGASVRNEAELRLLYLELSDGKPPPPARWARFIAPVSNRQILVRINNNLKHSYARRGEPEGALRAVERNLVLDPLAWHERRDRGLLLLQLGRTGEGRESLRHYLAGLPDAPDAGRVRQLLAQHRPGAVAAADEGDEGEP